MFLPEWCKITSDCWVLIIIENNYDPEIVKLPPLTTGDQAIDNVLSEMFSELNVFLEESTFRV